MSKRVWIGIAVVLVLVAIIGLVLLAVRTEPDVVKVGAVLPMTGAASSYGKWIERGMAIAAEDVNASGGVNGRKLEVLVEDSKSDNRAGLDAANKLISIDKVPVILTVMTGVTRSIIPVADRNHVVLFTLATAPGLTAEGKYVFRNATNISNELDRIVSACLAKLGFKSAAVIYVNYDAAPWTGQEFKKRIEGAGGRVVASESFQPDASDFRTQIEKIKAADPDALYIIGYQSTGLVMKQARELGLTCTFLGVSSVETPDVLAVAGAAAEGAIYTKAAFDPGSGQQAVADFVSKYKAQYGEMPEFYGATAYDATRIIALAMAKAGDDPARMREAILAIRDYPGASGTTTFLPNGDVEKPVELRTIRDGKPVVMGE